MWWQSIQDAAPASSAYAEPGEVLPFGSTATTGNPEVWGSSLWRPHRRSLEVADELHEDIPSAIETQSLDRR